MNENPRDDRAPADLEIGAVAKAKAIRFETVPETEISFPGSDEERSGSHTERENLPHEVEPGVTYRDVTVRWRAEASVRAEVADEVRDDLEEPGTRKERK